MAHLILESVLEHLAHGSRRLERLALWQLEEHAPGEAWLVPLDSEEKGALHLVAITLEHLRACSG